MLHNLEVGSYVEGFVGATVDDRFAGPIHLKGIIQSIKTGDQYAETEIVVKTEAFQ